MHLRILNFGQNTLQHYKTSVPSSLLHTCYGCKFKFSRELFKNTFTADCSQLMAEYKDKCIFYKFRAVLSHTPECLRKGKVGTESAVHQ